MGNNTLKWAFELIWIAITLLVCVGVLYPIYFGTINYPFYFINSIYIISFITITRYIFLFKHSFFARWQYTKAAIIFLGIPFIFYLGQELNLFQTYLDENGPESITGNIPIDAQNSMMKYIYNEMLLFGVGAMISALLFQMRLLLSIWRVYNNYEV